MKSEDLDKLAKYLKAQELNRERQRRYRAKKKKTTNEAMGFPKNMSPQEKAYTINNEKKHREEA